MERCERVGKSRAVGGEGGMDEEKKIKKEKKTKMKEKGPYNYLPQNKSEWLSFLGRDMWLRISIGKIIF